MTRYIRLVRAARTRTSACSGQRLALLGAAAEALRSPHLGTIVVQAKRGELPCRRPYEAKSRLSQVEAVA